MDVRVCTSEKTYKHAPTSEGREGWRGGKKGIIPLNGGENHIDFSIFEFWKFECQTNGQGGTQR